jgi:hypothetical protein
MKPGTACSRLLLIIIYRHSGQGDEASSSIRGSRAGLFRKSLTTLSAQLEQGFSECDPKATGFGPQPV